MLPQQHALKLDECSTFAMEPSVVVTTDSNDATCANDSPFKPKLTTTDYSEAVAFHTLQSSKTTLFPGDIYNDLTKFLKHTPNSGKRNEDLPAHSPTAFATLFKLNRQRCHSEQPAFDAFNDPATCIQSMQRSVEECEPQVLFLRGHPSPEWISSVGAFCHVDPEFFRWFLRYRSFPDSDQFFSAAPTTFSEIFHLKFTTIGCKDARDRSNQNAVDRLRKQAANDMSIYRTLLKNDRDFKQGDSIVRDFHVLDEKHCVIDQEASVTILDVGKTWIALICIDAGHDLSNGPKGPWLTGNGPSLRTRFLPVIQYQRRGALKSRTVYNSGIDLTFRTNPQSLMLLSEGFGTTLDKRIMKENPFYALMELFKFSAFSEQQFLNVVQQKIAADSNLASLQEPNPTLANLLLFREILQSHQSQIRCMIKLINSRDKLSHQGQRSSNTISPNLRKRAESSALELVDFYEDLLAQTNLLHDKCTLGMTVISNNTMLAESRRAIFQAQTMGKLTILAFIYLPFTFTTGFFGMNFKEFGTGKASIWAWFAISIPLFLISLASFIIDGHTLKRRFKSWKSRPARLKLGQKVIA